MLTRLKVNGFKSLVNVDVRFGPFTCVAGANGVGKSNLFDAITFLSDLADKPLMDAALSVRDEGARTGDVRGLFHRIGEQYAERMEFEADMIIPTEGVDDLGQAAEATTTFLRYKLCFELHEAALTLVEEDLRHITKGNAKSELGFEHSRDFRDSLGIGRRTSPFISTGEENGLFVKLHQDQPGDASGGRPRRLAAARLPRTVLTSAIANENPTVLLARREMQSWRLLQLEPSALRGSDSYNAPPGMDSHGAHMPATLARLTRLHRNRVGTVTEASPQESMRGGDAAVRTAITNRLAELIDGVRDIRLEADDKRELLTLLVTDAFGTTCEARALSDGTLRFLALAILERDSETRGVLCLEEPENGIHPERVPAMLQLLKDLAVDPHYPVGEDNALRQVIVNTHSPLVVAQVDQADVLFALGERDVRDGRRFSRTVFRALGGTWRSQRENGSPVVAPGDMRSYLGPIHRAVTETHGYVQDAARPRTRRVIDREDLQMTLPIVRDAPDRK